MRPSPYEQLLNQAKKNSETLLELFSYQEDYNKALIQTLRLNAHHIKQHILNNDIEYVKELMKQKLPDHVWKEILPDSFLSSVNIHTMKLIYEKSMKVHRQFFYLSFPYKKEELTKEAFEHNTDKLNYLVKYHSDIIYQNDSSLLSHYGEFYIDLKKHDALHRYCISKTNTFDIYQRYLAAPHMPAEYKEIFQQLLISDIRHKEDNWEKIVGTHDMDLIENLMSKGMEWIESKKMYAKISNMVFTEKSFRLIDYIAQHHDIYHGNHVILRSLLNVITRDSVQLEKRMQALKYVLGKYDLEKMSEAIEITENKIKKESESGHISGYVSPSLFDALDCVKSIHTQKMKDKYSESSVAKPRLI